MAKVVEWLKGTYSYEPLQPIMIVSYRLKHFRDNLYRIRIQIEGHPGNYPWGIQFDAGLFDISALEHALEFFDPVIPSLNNSGELYSSCFLGYYYWRGVELLFGWHKHNPPDIGVKIPAKAQNWLREELVILKEQKDAQSE